MYCSRCGKELADGVRFCKYCGYDLLSEEDGKTENGNEPKSVSDDSKAVINDAGSIGNDVSDVNCGNDVILTNTDSIAAPKSESVANDNSDVASSAESTADNSETGGIFGKKRRRKTKRMREIEDAIQLEKYTIKETSVSEAPYIDSERISLRRRGKIESLKAKEIIYIVIAAVIMIISAVFVTLARNSNSAGEDKITALVIIGYCLFFVIFFALVFGIDRIYNYLTLNELKSNRISLRRYGLTMSPLTLINGIVYSIDIKGVCDMCEGENKGTYHIEKLNDDYIAVCNYNRKHIYRIDVGSIFEEQHQGNV